MTVTGSVNSPYLFPLRNVDISPDGPSGWDIQAASDVSFETLETGGGKDVGWEVTPANSAETDTAGYTLFKPFATPRWRIS